MDQADRQETILHYVNRNKRARIRELAQMFGVSEVTIRNDIVQLSRMGLVVKTHGGAMSPSDMLSTEIPYVRKSAPSGWPPPGLSRTTTSLF